MSSSSKSRSKLLRSSNLPLSLSEPSSSPPSIDPRGTVPPSVVLAGGLLHKEILQSWIGTQPSPARIAARNRLLAYLNTLISSIGPQYSVVPFGSVAVGADGNTSDLDLAIRDATHPRGFDDPKLFLKKTAPYEMRRLARRLETEMVNVEPIPWAKVPVVKFKDPKSGIDVDINCNNLGGCNNSEWLLSYLQISPHTLRPLIHAVKKWASARKINDPAGQESGTSFSSYTLQLLCIAFLQAPIHQLPLHSIPVSLLPNLQSPALLARLKIPTTFIHLRDRPPVILKIDTTYAPLSSLPASETARWTTRNHGVDVGKLLQSFFRFYAGKSEDGSAFDWERGVVSPLEGGYALRLVPKSPGVENVLGKGQGGVWIRYTGEENRGEGLGWVTSERERREAKKANGRTAWLGGDQLVKWGNAGLAVKDPFEWHKNCTQHISPKTIRRIRAEFLRANEILATNSKASFLKDVCAEASLKDLGDDVAHNSAFAQRNR